MDCLLARLCSPQVLLIQYYLLCGMGGCHEFIQCETRISFPVIYQISSIRVISSHPAFRFTKLGSNSAYVLFLSFFFFPLLYFLSPLTVFYFRNLQSVSVRSNSRYHQRKHPTSRFSIFPTLSISTKDPITSTAQNNIIHYFRRTLGTISSLHKMSSISHLPKVRSH